MIDPSQVEFDPSSDHASLVTSYRLDIYVSGNGNPVQRVNLGKPDPGTDGKIRVDFTSLLATPLQAGVTYVATVAAVGSSGESVSGLTNTFTIGTACAPTLSSTSQSVPAAATTNTVAVTAGAGCAWTASSNAGWLTITGGGSGSGSGTTTYSVAANTAASPRTGTLTVAGAAFTVTQAGVSCAFSVSPASVTPSSASGTFSINVTTTTGCSWTSSSGVSWITRTSSASRTGSGAATFSYTANGGTSQRTGTVSVAGQSVAVTQAAPTACSYTVSPTSLTDTAAGSSNKTVTVTTTSACSWSIRSSASWITFPGATSRTGSGSVSVVIAPNSATGARTGTITIAGTAVSVSQAGVITAPSAPKNLRIVTGGGGGQ